MGIVCTSVANAASDDSGLAAKAHAILKNTCFRCHGQNGESEGGFNYALDHAQLLAKKKVVPGDPAKSRLFKRTKSGEMPPEDEKPRPSDADIAVLEKWIAAGAPAFPDAATSTTRPFRTEANVLAAIRDHLRQIDDEDRKYLRYFTLAHVANNAKVSGVDLRWYRAAFSKVANHLSWKPRIVLPKAVDSEETVYVVDLRELGWDRKGLWEEILRAYPYGLRFDEHPDENLRNVAREVYHLTGCELPYVRADWFVAMAARPPLYHTILDLPKHAHPLEHTLKVPVADNFLRNNLARAGFAKSGVSSQNRMIERHEASYGAYWKSYDFKANDGRGNLYQFPLGPEFRENPFADQAFVHDGGEIIFHLPNGLQGYLLVDGKDRRIDEGPTEVVSDGNKTSGTSAIVNGLSCMACHKHGMIRDGFKDEIRDGNAVSGPARTKTRKLYPAFDELMTLIKSDEDRFVASLDKAIGPFLKRGGDREKDIREFTEEPVSKIAKFYQRDVSLDEAAMELGFADPKQLAAAIQNNDRLRQLGMAPLIQGGMIKRDAWGSIKDRLSPFQRAAFELDRGTPHLPL
jgi:serine/threonine-protein kinase